MSLRDRESDEMNTHLIQGKLSFWVLGLFLVGITSLAIGCGAPPREEGPKTPVTTINSAAVNGVIVDFERKVTPPPKDPK